MKKLKNPNHKDGWYKIEPNDAQAILSKARLNRSIHQANVDKIAEDIRRGAWEPNGESVVFDLAGELLDGQHRMRACVAAGRPIIAYCVHGIQPDSFKTIDTGKVRGGGDLASILRLKNARICASVADWMIRYDGLKPGGRFPSGKAALIGNIAREEFFSKNRDHIEHAAAMAVKFGRQLRRLYPGVNTIAGVFGIISRVDPERAEKWLSMVATGEGLSHEHPVMLLRDKLIDLKASKYKADSRDVSALCIKSFLMYRDGRRVKLLKYTSEEAYPRVEV